MSNNPSHWDNCLLGERVQFQYGKSPSGVRLPGGRYPVYGSSGKTSEAIEFTTDAPSIIVGRKGTIDKPIFLEEQCWAIDTTFFIDKFPLDDPKYLFYLLDSINLRSLNESTGVPSLSRDALHSISVSLPPLPEQKKIAKILSGIDHAIEASKNLLQKSLDLKVAIIDEFCSDASTAQVDSLPLAEIAKSDAPICYGILMPGRYFHGGVPVVKVKNILNGSIAQDDLLLTDPEIDMKYERSRIAANDLLVTIRGSTGRTAFVPRNLHNANITQDTARVRVRGDMNRELVRIYIDSSSGQKYIEDHTIGQAVKGINLADLRSMPVPLKILDAAKEFACAVSAIEARVSLLSVKVEKLKSQKEAISNDLLSGRKRVSI